MPYILKKKCPLDTLKHFELDLQWALDGAETPSEPKDCDETPVKPGDGAEICIKPKDDAESTVVPEDGAEIPDKPQDSAVTPDKPEDGVEAPNNPEEENVKIWTLGIDKTSYCAETPEQLKGGTETPDKPEDGVEFLNKPEEENVKILLGINKTSDCAETHDKSKDGAETLDEPENGAETLGKSKDGAETLDKSKDGAETLMKSKEATDRNLSASESDDEDSAGNPIRAYDSLHKVCHRCGLDRPQDITSTNMRKYMATLAQVMNLSSSEMQQMCRHLGHTTRVHLAHYHTMSPYIERVTLGKINDPSTDNEDTYQFDNADMDADMDADNVDLHVNGEKEEKKAKPMKRQQWTLEEMAELQKYFSKHLNDKIAPRKTDCLKAKQASFKAGGELHKRPWSLIVKKISALNHSKKK